VSVHPEIPPEADLIRQQREAAIPEMSRRQAAAKAGISASQWSDVERGHKKAGSGVIVPVHATPDTLARMARVVGASADDLAAAGREDAARQLRNVDQERDLRQRIAAIPGLGVIGTSALSGTDNTELLPLIAAGLDAIERSDLPKTAKRELTSMFVDNLIHDTARRHSELLLMLRLAATGSHPGYRHAPRPASSEEADQRE
jgi:transcriptional regulator with XRE-family HTH domain